MAVDSSVGTGLAAHPSNGLLNPAVALGIGSFSPAYVWGPVVGGVAGAVLCATLASAVEAENGA